MSSDWGSTLLSSLKQCQHAVSLRSVLLKGTPPRAGMRFQTPATTNVAFAGARAANHLLLAHQTGLLIP